MLNEQVLFPLVKKWAPEKNVQLQSNDVAVVYISQNKSSVEPTSIIFPFGGFYCVPMLLLVLLKKGLWIKYFTAFHLGLFGISFLLFPFLGPKLGNFLSGLSQTMTMIIGFSITILAANRNQYINGS